MTEFTSHSVQETEQFAAHCAAKLRAGDVLACRGGMGMGKTAFARGLARGLGLSDEVSSPTLDRGGVLFIEWSENAAEALPPETVHVCFGRVDDETRTIALEGGPF